MQKLFHNYEKEPFRPDPTHRNACSEFLAIFHVLLADSSGLANIYKIPMQNSNFAQVLAGAGGDPGWLPYIICSFYTLKINILRDVVKINDFVYIYDVTHRRMINSVQKRRQRLSLLLEGWN